jgi:hypothetical protein
MTAPTSTPAERLRGLAETEFRLLKRELEAARRGKDGGVHRARKSLQRIRALVRLLAPADVEWARREDARLRRLRRRFGRLRDAAVRLELVQKLAKRELSETDRAHLERSLEQIREGRKAIWAQYPADAAVWDAIDKEAGKLHEGLARWPLDRITEKRVDRALERARLRLREALKDALGRIEHTHRHDLRRRLRRFAALRRAAAHVLRRRDAGSLVLVELAREMGGEGDLWMAAAALRKCGHAHETHALRKMLAHERRAACKRHDGELAAARRRLLEKPARRTRARTAAGDGEPRAAADPSPESPIPA